MNDPTPLPPTPAPLPPVPRHVHVVFGYPFAISGGVADAIKKAWPGDLSINVTNGWMLADTTELPAPVYEKLKAAHGSDVSVIVAKMDKYYGWYDKAVWDWIEARQNGR